MKKYWLWLVIALLFIPGLAVGASEPLPDKETVIAAADFIEQDPLSPDADAARSIVGVYAFESDDVLVLLSEKMLPWVGKNQWSDILLGSYIAGNVRSQLLQKQKLNDSYAGILMVLSTYAEIQKNDKTFKIEEIDKLVPLLKQGQLKQYIADLEKVIMQKPETKAN